MPNITAEQIERRLVVTVQGVDPIYVDPLPARRGRHLTEQFIRVSLGRLSAVEGEAVFIESVGAGNYAHLGGLVVDEFDDAGTYVATHSGAGTYTLDEHATARPDGLPPVRFLPREPGPDDRTTDAPAVRQEEVEAIALAAFYWQTVAGLDAVRLFIADGGGQAGSLKALRLLQIRLGLSAPTNSSRAGSAQSTQQAPTAPAPSTANSFADAPPHDANRQQRRAWRRANRRN